MLGAVIITFTMALHPVGGNIEHLLQVRLLTIITHGMAIFSVPLMLFGFYGLTISFPQSSWLNHLAFLNMAVGLIAVMMAAALNGLALPFFLDHQSGASQEQLPMIHLVMDYGFALNRAMDYIFIVGCCLSIGLWSFLSLNANTSIPKWTGWLGLIMSAATMIAILAGYGFTSLTGFRIFIGGLVVWMVASGYYLRKA